MANKKAAAKAKRKAPSRSSSWLDDWRVEDLLLWALVLLPPLVFSSRLQESFRLPKLLVAELLALGSLVALAWRLSSHESVDVRRFWRRPAVLASVPMVLVATLGLLTSPHPLHVRATLGSMWIGVACLVGWSLALRARELRQLLVGLLVPASLVALLGVLQFHGLMPLRFVFQDKLTSRLSLTSVAGGPFDLAAYLVLPILVAQAVLWASRGRLRWLAGIALVLSLYAAAVTQTLTALAAIALGSGVLWLRLLPARRLLAGGAVALVLASGLTLTVGPLRERVFSKVDSVRQGDVNRLLTGRLDGWRTAVWMLEQRPLTGVGLGAYRAEFGLAKLALREEGVRFYRRQNQVFFVNAHSDVLEGAAEWGWPGVLAMLWALVVLVRAATRAVRQRAFAASQAVDPAVARVARAESALVPAFLLAFGLLVATSFVWHLAHIAYPTLLFLAAVFRASGTADATDEAEAAR